ncbi:unnamed protein product [Mucor circinelloides]
MIAPRQKNTSGRQVKRLVLPLLVTGFIMWCVHSYFNNRIPESAEFTYQDMQKLSTLIAKQQQQLKQEQRENAVFVVLARNDDRIGIRNAMRQLEDRFNSKYNYPYVFLNDEPFDDDFIEYTSGLASGETYYGMIDESMWGYPDYIDQEKARQGREAMAEEEIPYGDSESYRHMCRFQSGFFFRHPLLDQYDYYWRVEPDVQFSCDVDYDPFKYMREHDLKYGFTISIREYALTIPTLWDTTKEFVKKHPDYIVSFNSSDSFIDWLSDDHGETYNMCHFWSNFEIGSLNWLRSKEYLAYFNHLDKAGGFFYERWGDAPVHSIAAALFLKRSEVHFFYDIGYYHGPILHCPSEPSWLPKEKCNCDPEDSMDDDRDFSCTAKYLDLIGKQKTDFLITERAPKRGRAF